jgi:hypothetical protein
MYNSSIVSKKKQADMTPAEDYRRQEALEEDPCTVYVRW